MKISRLTEADFDGIIKKIGGCRFSKDDTRERELNCDYEYNDALIELKLVEEEPTEKTTKQDKLARLFGSHTQTVVIDPEILSEENKNKYYRILETPIKTAVKQASKQLQKSSPKSMESKAKALIIINNGLTLMMPDEFERIAFKCAANDTSGIDILLVGGVYFFSDKFDSYVIFPLKELYLNCHRSDIVDAIRRGWNDFLYDFMSRQVTDITIQRNKEPLRDITFRVADVLYIKPHPKFGKTSNFWPNGVRPREDSTGISSCPPVATVLPRLDYESYKVAAKSIEDTWRLCGDLRGYLNWLSDEIRETMSLTCPLVAVLVPSENANVCSFYHLCEVAANIFDAKTQKLMMGATEFSNAHQSLNYILLTCCEIGIDKANDISFIEHINEFPGLEKQTCIIDGERLKFEYALAIASSYCIKLGADCVYYIPDEKYKFT